MIPVASNQALNISVLELLIVLAELSFPMKYPAVHSRSGIELNDISSGMVPIEKYCSDS